MQPRSLGQVRHIVGTNFQSWKLYRTVLRHLPKLPHESYDYYHDFAKQHFLAHQDEEASRAEELIQRGYFNFKWVLAKYGVEVDESVIIPEQYRQSS